MSDINKIRLSYNDLSEREKIRILIMILTKLGPSGGIGRHKGLKILDSNIVPVQVRPGHQKRACNGK